MGRDVDPGKDSGGTECTWDGTTDVGLSVILDVRHGTPQEVADYFDVPVGGANAQDVDGLGDGAHWLDGLNVMEVLQGNYDFSVQLIDLLSPTGSKLDQAKALASDVSSKLP
jgi:hypothetical protein